jgi:UDP-3-O-[3-hydroxymyristoyl] glucosamine N-acyltransferase
LSHRLGELGKLVGGVVRGDGDRRLEGIGTLSEAGADELSFLTNSAYQEEASRSRAGALLVPSGMENLSQDLLICENPYLALAQILSLFHPSSSPAAGIDETAVLGVGVKVAPSASIGPYCVIGDDTVVGEDAVVHPHCVIGASCVIGAGSLLYPQVSIYDDTVLGSRVILHSGVVLGADGFGFAQSPEGHVKVPQVGRVVVEDDVEIGANSTVDRAMLDETHIGANTKIDNLVMVAHNVRLGRSCLLISQAGVAGSSTLGAGVVVAGQSGISGHVDLGDGVQVASKSAVYKSAEKGARLAGIPAIDAMAWKRQQVRLMRLQSLEQRLIAVERQLKENVKDEPSNV